LKTTEQLTTGKNDFTRKQSTQQSTDQFPFHAVPVLVNQSPEFL